MKAPTDHVAVINPFVPARWIARELHRLGTKDFENLDTTFLKSIPVHVLDPKPEAEDDGSESEEVEITHGGSVKRNATRWPPGLPKVGSLPGDMMLDFASLNAPNSHSMAYLDTENGPNTYGGMKNRCGYYLLDAASLCAPLVLDPQAGQRVLDVCAAPGGKSLIMAYLMFARQEILKSARELKETLHRLRDGGQETRLTLGHDRRGGYDSDDEYSGMALSDDEDNIRDVRDKRPGLDLSSLAGGFNTQEEQKSSGAVNQLTQELAELQVQLTSGALDENEALAVEAMADLLLAQLEQAQSAESEAAAKNSDDDDEDEDDEERTKRSKLVLNDVSRQRCERLQQVVKDYIPFYLWPDIDVVNVDATTCYQFGSITMNAFGRRQLVSSTNTKTGDVSAERTAKRHDAQKAQKSQGSTRGQKSSGYEELLHCEGEFDRIMLDAPCSSDRHLLHSAENMGLWSEAATRAQAKRQIQLLRNSIKALKVGGRVVYSTCSLSPYENDGVVATILNEYGPAVKLHKFKLPIGERTPYGYMILPDKPNCSWGPLYVASIERLE